MELRVLRYFLGVAREGSITGAAQALHVTQPTLSRQLKDLEDELGQQLFIRGSHSVSLTPEGMLLRKRAGEIMEMVHKTEAEFNSMGGCRLRRRLHRRRRNRRNASDCPDHRGTA